MCMVVKKRWKDGEEALFMLLGRRWVAAINQAKRECCDYMREWEWSFRLILRGEWGSDGSCEQHL